VSIVVQVIFTQTFARIHFIFQIACFLLKRIYFVIFYVERRKVLFVPSFYRNISVFHFSIFSIHFPFAGSHKTFAAGAKTLLVLGIIPEIGKSLFCGASGPFLPNSFVFNTTLHNMPLCVCSICPKSVKMQFPLICVIAYAMRQIVS